MKRIGDRVFLLILILPYVVAVGDDRDKEPAKAEQQYRELLKQYNDAFEEYAAAFREAPLPEDREKVIREMYPGSDKWAGRFLELAGKNPLEPFAEEALIWIVTNEARLK